MYNIVIVDDEPLVIYGVSAILKKRDSWFKIVKTFQEGNSAMEFCRKNPPDLLLTDIRMPGMDGLSLIEALKPELPEMKIIVLSCHEEFNLVHSAFKLGADEYLLKHNLEENSFMEILTNLLPPECHSPGKTDENEQDRLPEGAGMVGILGFKQEYSPDMELIPWAPDMNIIRQIIDNNLKEAKGEKCFVGSRDEVFLFIPNTDSSLSRENERIKARFENLRNLLSGYINRQIFIALEEVKENSVNRACEKARNILEQRFYREKSCLLFSSMEMSPEEKIQRPVFSPAGKNKIEEWNSLLGEFLAHGRKNRIRPALLRSDIAYALHHLIYELEELSEKDLPGVLPLRPEDIYSELIKIDDWNILRTWTEQKLKDISRLLGNIKKNRTISSSVKVYVKNHFAEPISLPEVAALFNVTPSYLSTSFKQETGSSFVEFVNKTRLDYACNLLSATDLTVKEVAYRAGYENPNYFSRLFKKQTGKTVSDYRKEIIDREYQ